ncbi:hypothetical protein DIPPA_21358 [Diplonema papillatum]|nr:hypothetical protein DIPPA_21358 [Diplonema papillatum]
MLSLLRHYLVEWQGRLAAAALVAYVLTIAANLYLRAASGSAGLLEMQYGEIPLGNGEIQAWLAAYGDGGRALHAVFILVVDVVFIATLYPLIASGFLFCSEKLEGGAKQATDYAAALVLVPMLSDVVEDIVELHILNLHAKGEPPAGGTALSAAILIKLCMVVPLGIAAVVAFLYVRHWKPEPAADVSDAVSRRSKRSRGSKAATLGSTRPSATPTPYMVTPTSQPQHPLACFPPTDRASSPGSYSPSDPPLSATERQVSSAEPFSTPKPTFYHHHPSGTAPLPTTAPGSLPSVEAAAVSISPNLRFEHYLPPGK